MGKSVKSPKKKQQRKNKSSKKAFNITEDTRGIVIGVVAAAGLVGLGYATVITPILEEKKLRAREAKEAEELNNIVGKRMEQRRESAKVKALKAYEDIQRKLAETVLTLEPRVSIPSTSPRSPKVNVFSKVPDFLRNTSKVSVSRRTSLPSNISSITPKASFSAYLDGIPKNLQKFTAPDVPVTPEFTYKGSPEVSGGLRPVAFPILGSITVVPRKTPVQLAVQKPEKTKNSLKTSGNPPRYNDFTRTTDKKIFTSQQKIEIFSLIESDKDTTEYIRKIVGKDYIPSKIKLDKSDSLEFHLFVIKEAVMGHSDPYILKGLAHIRKKTFLKQNQPIVPKFVKLADGTIVKNPDILPN